MRAIHRHTQLFLQQVSKDWRNSKINIKEASGQGKTENLSPSRLHTINRACSRKALAHTDVVGVLLK